MQTRDVPEPWASRMIQRGLTRRDGRPNVSALAREAGVAVETARRVVHGIGVADADTAASLATVLGDDVTDWLEWRADGLEEWRPPSESRLLTRDEREVLDRLVRLIVLDRRSGGFDLQVEKIVATGPIKRSTLPGQVVGRELPSLVRPEAGDLEQAEAFLAGDDDELEQLKTKKAQGERLARQQAAADAARERGKPGSVAAAKEAQDRATTRPDPEGPEFGA